MTLTHYLVHVLLFTVCVGVQCCVGLSGACDAANRAGIDT